MEALCRLSYSGGPAMIATAWRASVIPPAGAGPVSREYVPHTRSHVENGGRSRVPMPVLIGAAVVAATAGGFVGGVAAVGAWSGRGGGCLGHLGGGLFDLYYPFVCNTAWKTGLALGGLAGLGTAIWAVTGRRRRRTIVHEALTGLLTFALGIAGMAFGIYLAADTFQEDTHASTDATIYTRGTVGFLAGTAIVALVMVSKWAAERRKAARSDRA